MKKGSQTLAFFSMLLGWVLMNLLFYLYLIILDGKVKDYGLIVFMSGIFVFIAWIIFIAIPVYFLDHSKAFFKPSIFPFISGFYGVIVSTLIFRLIFREWPATFGIPTLAFLTGLLFGMSYSLFIRSDKLLTFLQKKPILEVISFLFLLLVVISTLFYISRLPS
jgi:hypothetical protein